MILPHIHVCEILSAYFAVTLWTESSSSRTKNAETMQVTIAITMSGKITQVAVNVG